MKLLPPAARGHPALRLTAAAARGRFELQECGRCHALQYPPRELCQRCLSGELAWIEQSGAGTLLAVTTLAHSNDGYFRAMLPLNVGLVQLTAGPTLIVHVHSAISGAPAPVRIVARLDAAGQAALIALPVNQAEAMESDKMLQAMGCDPRGRHVLITDGQSELGQSLVRALLEAGARHIWSGRAGGGESAAHSAPVARVGPRTLDVGDRPALAQLAAEIGPELDILINTHDLRAGPAAADAASDMNHHYFGLLNLIECFEPWLARRAAAGGTQAWVNLLSICSLISLPGYDSYCASKAAAHSLTQSLRRRMQPHGVRVIGVYPDPMDSIDARALADDLVLALRDGIEDLYPGPGAKAWADELCGSPKVLEREITLAAGGK